MRSLKSLASSASFVVLLTACAGSNNMVAGRTNSTGEPAGRIDGATVAGVQGKVESLCVADGLKVIESTSSKLVCGKAISARNMPAGSLGLGSVISGSRLWEGYQFSYRQEGSQVVIYGHEWRDIGTSPSRVERKMLTGKEPINQMRKRLYALGAR